MTVFGVMLLAMLLGLVVNTGKQIDQKVRLQNAADSSAYAGGVVFARNMNATAMTNHLLCEVFALVAILREADLDNAKGGNAYALAPEILDAWENVPRWLAGAPLVRFDLLGNAPNYDLPAKIALERQLVESYSQWANETGRLMLPTLESILIEEMVPRFQSSLAPRTGAMVADTVAEVARRHPWPAGDIDARVFTTDGVAAIEEGGGRPLLPLVDPHGDGAYLEDARQMRAYWANHYLESWNAELMTFFDRRAKLSRFATLWRGFTCGQLDSLLNAEYPDRNLPMMIRQDLRAPGTSPEVAADLLQRDCMFVGVAAAEPVEPTLPGLFRTGRDGRQVAFCQFLAFVSHTRPLAPVFSQGGGDAGGVGIGGVPGNVITADARVSYPTAARAMQPGRTVPGEEVLDFEDAYPNGRGGDDEPGYWDSFNQNWSVKLVPATAPAIPELLERMAGEGGASSPYSLVSPEALREGNFH